MKQESRVPLHSLKKRASSHIPSTGDDAFDRVQAGIVRVLEET